MPGYRGCPVSSTVGEGSAVLRGLGLGWRLSTTRRHQSFVRGFRDFYVNIRSPAYMTARVGDYLDTLPQRPKVTLVHPATVHPQPPAGKAAGRPDDADSWACSWADHRIACDFSSPGNVTGAVQQAVRADAATAADGVLLVHSDALGLGLGQIEAILLRGMPGKVTVLTGRRRVYDLTPQMRTRLGRHRFLAETRIAESLAGLVVVPLANGLGWLDTFRRR
jgi:hypothetical protein